MLATAERNVQLARKSPRTIITTATANESFSEKLRKATERRRKARNEQGKPDRYRKPVRRQRGKGE
jgi:hypothetical protein